ncbi:uncharacterized protein LOC111532237 [Piliocolobus tephrosceles]|uniref:uncharacterized protein LOC111532237 n=1 Tax=Piliocolobus tephrosceles TaxID=591936 RepID=UPI000E6AFC5B|nr:uncharacterized protein LOC111532237 [Piliocolobus tephrosceles]
MRQMILVQSLAKRRPAQLGNGERIPNGIPRPSQPPSASGRREMNPGDAGGRGRQVAASQGVPSPLVLPWASLIVGIAVTLFPGCRPCNRFFLSPQHISWSRLNMGAISPIGRSGCGLCTLIHTRRSMSASTATWESSGRWRSWSGGESRNGNSQKNLLGYLRVCWTPTADTTMRFLRASPCRGADTLDFSQQPPELKVILRKEPLNLARKHEKIACLASRSSTKGKLSQDRVCSCYNDLAENVLPGGFLSPALGLEVPVLMAIPHLHSFLVPLVPSLTASHKSEITLYVMLLNFSGINME